MTKTISNWQVRVPRYGEEQDVRKKYWILSEGTNTEYWYFRRLNELRAVLGIDPLIAILPVKKDNEGHSDPKTLLMEAEKLENDTEVNGYTSETDEIVLIFDADIYSSKPDEYSVLLKDIQKNKYLYGVTNPAFELFLLLHLKGSLEKTIFPNQQEILENRKKSKNGHRYVAHLLSEETNKNPKKNPAIANLAKDVAVAIEQEKMLNQDPEAAIHSLTSNIGTIIQKMMDES